ncbi:MAG: class I tRNA ligase family protein, partial [Nocardioidaceae bacterium]
DVSPAGSLRFLQRAWRVAHEVASEPGTDPAGGDTSLRKVTHRIVRECQELLDSYRFNVVVARVMELVNATRKAIDSGPGAADPAVREAAETTAILLSMIAPYVAEDMWAQLGHEPTVAGASWPAVDESLLVEDSVTCVVQVQGKVRGKVQVAPGISEDELQDLALAEPNVRRFIDDREIRKVIVRAPKLVNIVV